MRLRDTIISVTAFVIAAALFFAAGSQLDSINSDRKEMKLIINEPLENAPPSLAFATMAMGAFRGLVVDVLWMRADRLKEEGQFFDAKQLAEWITVLQPRFPQVWEFNAWNMAYNISVAIPATQPQERWRWVKNGYELLRDKGIEINPKSILLYRELARIFQHKIGGVTDEAHKYYKLQLAISMEPLLGPADNDYFSKLAKATKTWEEITADPNVADFVDKLKNADDKFADNDYFVGNYLSLRQKPDIFSQEASYILEDFTDSKTLEKFDIFARAYQLRKTWKLEPVLMEKLNQNYGPTDPHDPNTRHPLEWRHPHTHAIYWAVRGLKLASKGEFDAHETNTDRIVAHSLQGLFRNGKIYIHTSVDPNTKVEQKSIYLRSDLAMFDTYNISALSIIDKYKNLENASKGTITSLQTGHRNMLTNAAFSFYQSGNKKKALAIFNKLRKIYPDKRFNMSLTVFMKKRMDEELSSIIIHNAREMVQMILMESFFMYAMGEDDQAYNKEQIAAQVHNYYQTSSTDENRINLPPFDMFKYFAIRDFFADPQYPPDLKTSLLNRIRIEKPELAKKFEQIETQLLQNVPKQKPDNQ